jgi:hypothetical protein
MKDTQKGRIRLMNESISSFKPDLRISPVWVIAAMAAAGVALGLATQMQSSLASPP